LLAKTMESIDILRGGRKISYLAAGVYFNALHHRRNGPHLDIIQLT
jgi:hypothetical protein